MLYHASHPDKQKSRKKQKIKDTSSLMHAYFWSLQVESDTIDDHARLDVRSEYQLQKLFVFVVLWT